MKNKLKPRLQQHRHETAINGIVLAVFIQKKKRESKRVTWFMRQFLKEGVKETKKEKMPMASDGGKKKTKTQTYLGVEGIHLKKCSRWRAE